MTYASSPQRPLTDEEIKAYHRDGVIMVKQLLERNWLSMLDAGVEQARRDASIAGRFMSRKSPGYQMDLFLWKRIDEIRDVIYYSPLSHLAQQLMGSDEIRFFYDQLFVKEPGTDAPTPWHQDMSFWPLEGDQLCSFWFPLDPVTKANSGLQYVKGSHRWPNRYKAISPDYNASLLTDGDYEDVPDINAEPEKYDVACWDMEPGDALIFHPLTLHGSSGNTTRDKRRRALALRFFGDDVVYRPNTSCLPFPYAHSSKPGGALRGAAFPLTFPGIVESERAARARGPELPRPGAAMKALVNNIKAAIRLKREGFDAEELKQTW